MKKYHWNDIAAPGECFHVASLHLKGGGTYPIHSHDFGECFLVVDGKGMHHINGSREKIRKGELLFIHPRDMHGFSCRGNERLLYYNVAFPFSYYESFLEIHRKDLGDFFKIFSCLPLSFHLEDVIIAKLSDIFIELSQLQRTRFEYDRFILNLFHHIMNRHPLADALPEEAPYWLRTACMDMHKEENLKSGIAQFVALSGRSKEHSGRELKKWTGLTATAYINHIRLKKVKYLLVMTDRAIDDIAASVGFTHMGYFYTLFRTHCAMSPRIFRRKKKMYL